MPLISGHVTRFAPSPTGLLHLGHVVSLMHAQQCARQGGQFLVRIEDIDPARCRNAFSEKILEDIRWLGFTPSAPILFQSRNLSRYRAALQSLKDRGLVYPCTCSRQEIVQRGGGRMPDGFLRYDGQCRDIGGDSSRAPAWRLDMRRALDELDGAPSWEEAGKGRVTGDALAFGDIVLGRRDCGLSYHLCVTCDDAAQRITCVTRGEDLKETTVIHRVLQTLLGLPEPLYAHHPLVLDGDGRKLSKSTNAPALQDMRSAGMTSQDVLGIACALIQSTG